MPLHGKELVRHWSAPTPLSNPLDWMKLCYWAVGIFIVVAMYLRRRAQKLAFVPRRYVSRLQGEVAEELQAPAAPTDWKD